MATSTTTTSARKSTSPKATPATPAPAPATTTTAPVGATTTTAVGTPQSQVAALVHLLATLEGVALAQPDAAWPGYGKVVRLTGTAAAVYVNRGNLDIRTSPAQASKWAKAGLGVARGPQGQYLRMAFSATGTSK